MTDTFKKLFQSQPGTSAAALYTVPSATQAIVKHIRAVNPTGTDQTLTLWQAGTADTNMILPPATIAAGGWAEFDGAILMSATEVLNGKASAGTAITVTGYGDEIS